MVRNLASLLSTANISFLPLAGSYSIQTTLSEPLYQDRFSTEVGRQNINRREIIKSWAKWSTWNLNMTR